MKKNEIKIGDLVKDKWATAKKVEAWKRKAYNETADVYIPPIGIVTKITIEDSLKHKKVDSIDTKDNVKITVAHIDWFITQIPELNAVTSKYELDTYIKYRSKSETRYLTHYETYYSSFKKRWAKKEVA